MRASSLGNILKMAEATNRGFVNGRAGRRGRGRGGPVRCVCVGGAAGDGYKNTHRHQGPVVLTSAIALELVSWQCSFLFLDL